MRYTGKVQTFLWLPTEVNSTNKTRLKSKQEEEEENTTNRPAVVLAEDVFDSLCQGECLARAVGPDDEDWGQGDGDGRGDGQDGLFLLGIQTGIQLLIPLPGGGRDKAEIIRGINKLTFN